MTQATVAEVIASLRAENKSDIEIAAICARSRLPLPAGNFHHWTPLSVRAAVSEDESGMLASGHKGGPPVIVLSDEQLEREYRSWDDATIREHYEAAKREEQVQFRLGDKLTALLAQRCRQTANRFSREMQRRAREGFVR